MGSTLARADVEGKIRSVNCRHEIRTVGDPTGKSYVTKYVMGVDATPVITGVCIYADSRGHYAIPKEYRSSVVYGEDIKTMAVALYSEDAMSNDRIAAFLNAVSGSTA